MNRATAIALAAIMVVSMLAAPLGAAVVGAQTSGPSGMVALGSDQVDEDIPDGETLPIDAADLEGAVYANDHADTLEAIVTTPERAEEEYLDAGTIVTNDEVALVLRDDEVHDGREIAVELALLETAVGFAPEVAYGIHESGEEWQSPIDKDGEVGVFEVPEFSDNTVTFSGGITLSGDAAGDGTTYEYQLADLDGVDNFVINATGVENAEVASKSAVRSDGEGLTLGVGGNSAPRDETVSITGVENIEPGSAEGASDATVSTDGNTEPRGVTIEPDITNHDSDVTNDFSNLQTTDRPQETHTFNAPDYLYQYRIEAYQTDWDNSYSYDVYFDGEQVGSINGVDDPPGWHTVTFSEPYETGGSIDVELVPRDSGAGNLYINEKDLRAADAEVSIGVDGDTNEWVGDDGEARDTSLSLGDNTVQTEVHIGNVDLSWQLNWTQVTQTKDPLAEVNGEVIQHDGILGDGETVEKTVDLSSGENTVDISTDGEANIAASWTEVTQTRDPVVEVNGYETEHTGTLADGETTSLATNEAWLEEGTNTVTVRTNSPATGPESLTGFEYAHDASGTTQSVDVDATSWTESFNVSNTYPSAVSDANAVLTFNDRVAEIDNVEYRLNGGEWESPPSHELDGTDLEVMIGDVEDDTTVDVQATGHKIQTYDGDVEIVEPTVEGDDLATEV